MGAVLERQSTRNQGHLWRAPWYPRFDEDEFIDLRKESPANLELVAATPSSALGSVRKKPTADDCRKVFDVMQQRDIRYLFYIGGNDSAETAGILSDEAHKAGFDFRCFHIPKTIDNDLLENDHTPGFGSAAKFVACAFMGDNLDSAALPGVKIDVVMGRMRLFTAAQPWPASIPMTAPTSFTCLNDL